MSKIFAIKIPDRLDKVYYDFFISKVSTSRQNQIKKYVNLEDAYRSLLGEVLTRAVICKYLNYPNEEIQFEKNEYGKPLLAENHGFSFNVSHSGEFVVIIFGSGLLGIDIEEVTTIDLTIAERFFSWEEHEDLMNKAVEQRLDYFYDLWTLKESFIKALGTGLSRPLNSFSIREKSNGHFTLLSEVEKFYFKKFDIQHTYKLSACSNQNNLPERINYLELKDLHAWLSDTF